MILFISGGEIFIILLFILIFFGADKIPEFTRFMGKGVREFKKATDDIKREINDSSAGVLDDFKSISNDLTNSLTKEISDPIKKTVNEAQKTFDDYQDQYNNDYYYDNQNNMDGSGYSYGNEYQNEPLPTTSERVENVESEAPGDVDAHVATVEGADETEPASEHVNPDEA